MEKKKGDYIFRRVRGRIIPIRLTKRGENIAGGVGKTVAGVGVAAASGLAASQLVTQSAKIRTKAGVMFRAYRKEQSLRKTGQTAFNIMGGDRKIASKINTAVKHRYIAGKMFSLRNPVMAFGALFGAGLISRGLSKTYDGATGKKHDGVVFGLGEDAVSVGLALGASAIYYNRLGLKGVSSLKHIINRMKNVPRPSNIPIKHDYGTLRFPGV